MRSSGHTTAAKSRTWISCILAIGSSGITESSDRKAVIVTELVAVTAAHPPAAALVLVTVYVPGVLADKST